METDRLRLRGWRECDFDRVAAQYADPEMARYIGGVADRPSTWRRFASLIGHWALRGFGYWAVEERAGGGFVGAVGLWFPEGWPELELGYWLAREMQGRGYATEAAAAARNYAYKDLASPTLVSYIHPDNEASRRVAERLGAHRETTIELLDYGPHDVYRYPRPDGTA